MIEPKPVKERTNLGLLELVCQLHSRALQYPSKEMHDAYLEARQELETRLEQKLNKHVVSAKRPDCPYCIEPISERMIEEWITWAKNAKAACANE